VTTHARNYEPGACDKTRACVRMFNHRGPCMPKLCARPGCTNRTRNVDEPHCTVHEDRATYERYEHLTGQDVGS
jgi:hypothetical protein